MPSIQEDLQPYFLQPLTVLNLVISGIPSIHFQYTMEVRDLQF